MTQLPLSRLLVWASPASALAALGLPLAMFLPNFYVENIGVSAGATALVFLLLRLWDGITDPLIGSVSDRLNPPIGRRRFWVVAALPFLMIATWMVLVPSSQAGAIYLGAWLMVLYVGITAMQVGHISWGAELAPSYDARSRLMGWYEVFVIAGLLALLALAAVLEIGTPADQVQDQRADTLRAMALFLIILFPLTALPAVILVKEGEHKPQNSFSILDGFLAVTRNKGLRNVLGANLLYRAATGISGTLFLWYVSLRLDLAGLAAVMMALYFLFALISMPLWMRLTRIFGKRAVYLTALIAAICTSIPFAFIDGVDPIFGDVTAAALSIGTTSLNHDQLTGLVLTCVVGSLYGVAPFLARAMMADVVDEELLQSRAERTGLFYALLSFSEKLGFAIAVGASVYSLQLIGLETGPGAVPTADAIGRLALVYAFGPMLLYGLAIGLVYRFHISKAVQAETREQLVAENLV